MNFYFAASRRLFFFFLHCNTLAIIQARRTEDMEGLQTETQH